MSTDTDLRSRQITGLLLLAAAILLAAIARSNKQDLLPSGWWHVW